MSPFWIWMQVLIVVFTLAGDRHRHHAPDLMALFDSIVVGTDGSDTAREAVRRAVELARVLGARVQVVSASSPSPSRLAAPVATEDDAARAADAWTVAPREGVDAILADVVAVASAAGSRPRSTRARGARPTRSSTWPRRRAPTSSWSATRG